MKKTMKKVLSGILSATLLFCGMNVVSLEAKAADDHTAFLVFTDRDWAYGNWDSSLESATTSVTGDGSYSVTLNAAEVGGTDAGANGAMVFCVDIVAAQQDMEEGKTYEVSEVEVLADGEAIDVDASKIVTGDIEGNGNFRIEIYNEYGNTAADSPIDQEALTFKDTLTVNFTLTSIECDTPTPIDAEEETSTASVDLNGTYHAYIGLQSPTYTFRNAFDDATYGRDTEYFNQMTGWDNNNVITKPGTFVDAEITGNGTYTIAANGLDMAGEFDSQDHFNLIFISTDIPNSGEITISDIVLNIDGRDVSINPILFADSVDYVNMTIQNIWNDNADVQTIGYYNVPPTDVTITFTVSGFAYDNTNTAVEETAADTTTDSAVAEEAAEEVEESSNTTVVVVVVIVIVVIVVVAAVLLMNSKKKKENK